MTSPTATPDPYARAGYDQIEHRDVTSHLGPLLVQQNDRQFTISKHNMLNQERTKPQAEFGP